MLTGLEPVGQNRCQDQRGDRAVFYQAQTESSTAQDNTLRREDVPGIPLETAR